MISNSLFYHEELNIEHHPTTAILNEERLPICYLDDETKMSDTKLQEKIEKFENDGEPLDLKIRRSYHKANWGFRNPFVIKFLKYYGMNAAKVIDNDTKILVFYLWGRYRWLARIFSLIYFTFMTTTITTLVWCYDTGSCENFIDLGPMNLPFLILIRVLMFSTYLFLVFLEILSIFSRGLKHFKYFYNKIDFIMLVGFIPAIVLVLAGSSV